MITKKRQLILTLALLLLTIVGGCDAMSGNNSQGIQASGVVEVVEVIVAAELSGTVTEINVNESDQVHVGDPLFVLENDILQAQYNQALAECGVADANMVTARAALESAQAVVDSSKINLELVLLQYELAIKSARIQDMPTRMESWDKDVPAEFDFPVWYFNKNEEINAAESEINQALIDYDFEMSNLAGILENASYADIMAAEERLAQALTAFIVAQELRDRTIAQNGREAITDYIDSLFNATEAELESAQAEYDNLLSNVGAEDVLEARARVAVSAERYQIALFELYRLQTGDDALEIQVARLAVAQAEAMVTQAEAGYAQAESGVKQAEKMIDQAQASLDLLEIQIKKLTVKSPSDGVVLIKTIEVGELVQPGITVMTIGQLDTLTITVYVPEDKYGIIGLGDSVEVQVDSFGDKVFSASVTRIADQAEYTPRNVQTAEDRRTTVFAIELSVDDPDGVLKPGMPADVTFP